MQYLTLKLIDLYQAFFSFDRGIFMFLAPGGACKYEITCSEFTRNKIIEHGALKGILLGMRRIASCR